MMKLSSKLTRKNLKNFDCFNFYKDLIARKSFSILFKCNYLIIIQTVHS